MTSPLIPNMGHQRPIEMARCKRMDPRVFSPWHSPPRSFLSLNTLVEDSIHVHRVFRDTYMFIVLIGGRLSIEDSIRGRFLAFYLVPKCTRAAFPEPQSPCYPAPVFSRKPLVVIFVSSCTSRRLRGSKTRFGSAFSGILPKPPRPRLVPPTRWRRP